MILGPFKGCYEGQFWLPRFFELSKYSQLNIKSIINLTYFFNIFLLDGRMKRQTGRLDQPDVRTILTSSGEFSGRWERRGGRRRARR